MADFDFGFSTVDSIGLQEEADQRVENIKAMIMPLLKNLMANSDSPYIHWPNRKEKIEEFIERLNEI